MAERVRDIYATALFDAAASDGERETVLAQLRELVELFANIPDYMRLMSTPAVSKEEKRKLIEDAFSKQVHPKLVNLMKVLVNNGRFMEFGSVAERYAELVDEHNGLLAVTAVSAMPLREEMLARLRQKLEAQTGREIRLTVEVDPALLGGLLLRCGGREIDGTIRTQLEGMRQKIMDAAIN